MNSTNETCVQRVQVVFAQRSSPAKKRVWRIPGLDRPLRTADVNRGGTESAGIDPARLQALIHTCQRDHDGWRIYASRRHIVLETTTLDYSHVTQLLEGHGLIHSDYELKVEYERKWGLL